MAEPLLDFMMAHPILINRPIVFTPKGVRHCRPSEMVLDILPNSNIGRFVKEGGEIVEAGAAPTSAGTPASVPLVLNCVKTAQ